MITTVKSNPVLWDIIPLLETEDYIPNWERPEQLEGKSIPMPDISMLNPEQAVGFSKYIQFYKGELSRTNPQTGMDYPVDMLVLQGVAGTGKSFLNSKAVQFLIHKDPTIKIGILTPTHQAGAAAKKLSSLTQIDQIQFATIHSIAGVRKVNDEATGRETFPPIKDPKFDQFDLIIIDEAGMVAEELYMLVRAYSGVTKIIWTGDPAQLPPVGENLSKAYDRTQDFVEVDGLGLVVTDRVELTQPMRAAQDHPITSLATSMRNRMLHPKQARGVLDQNGFRVIKTVPKDRERGVDEDLDSLLLTLFTSDHYKNDSDYCTLLTWSNKSVGQWNNRVRRLIWQKETGRPSGMPVLFPYEYIKLQEAYVVKNEDEDMLDDRGYFNKPDKEDRGVQIYANNDVLRVVSFRAYTLDIPGTGDSVQALMCETEKYIHGSGWVSRKDVPVLLSDQMYQFEAAMSKLWNYAQTVDPDMKAVYWDLRNYGPVKAHYAYASTTHKRQGCTDFINIIDAANIGSSKYFPKTVPENIRMDHYWRMIYTAGTRAKKGVVYLV